MKFLEDEGGDEMEGNEGVMAGRACRMERLREQVVVHTVLVRLIQCNLTRVEAVAVAFLQASMYHSMTYAKHCFYR